MNYLLSQIWLCLGLTALIAGFAGWFLRGSSKAKIKAMKEEWKVRLARAQNERDYYAGEVKSLSAMAEEREIAEQNYQSEKQALSIQLDDMRVDAEMTSDAFKEQEHLLKQQASELEASNRALLASSDKQQQFQQKLIDNETRTEKTVVALQVAEEKLSDLQTELDSTKIQLLDTTDKLSITEGMLAEKQHLTAQEGQTILLVKDEENQQKPTPSPAPILHNNESTEKRNIPDVGSLLSTATSSVEIVDAHDKMPNDVDVVDAHNKMPSDVDLMEEKLLDSQKSTKQEFIDAAPTMNTSESTNTKATKTTEQELDDAFNSTPSNTTVITSTAKTANIETDLGSENNQSYKEPKPDESATVDSRKTDHVPTDDTIADKDSKSATLAGAGAAALGMAGKMKNKLTQAKDDLIEKVDFSSEVYAIQDIHTINNESAKYLSRMNVLSTEDLIDRCSSKEGVELMAKSMGKESWVVRSWVSMADLMRVKGVDGINAELLELSGVSSVQALASAKAQRLTDSIKVIHKHVGKTTHVPDYEEIEAWVKRAEDLPKRLDDHLDKL